MKATQNLPILDVHVPNLSPSLMCIVRTGKGSTSWVSLCACIYMYIQMYVPSEWSLHAYSSLSSATPCSFCMCYTTLNSVCDINVVHEVVGADPLIQLVFSGLGSVVCCVAMSLWCLSGCAFLHCGNRERGDPYESTSTHDSSHALLHLRGQFTHSTCTTVYPITYT